MSISHDAVLVAYKECDLPLPIIDKVIKAYEAAKASGQPVERTKAFASWWKEFEKTHGQKFLSAHDIASIAFRAAWGVSWSNGHAAGLDAMAAPKRESSWQPIEIAPRDGTEIDLWDERGFRITNCKWDSENNIWIPGDGPCFNDEGISNWMSLPEPPTMNEDIGKLAIQNGLMDSPTAFVHREKIEGALKSISDDGKCDAGIGFGGFDFWIKMQGIEYYFNVKSKSGKP